MTADSGPGLNNRPAVREAKTPVQQDARQRRLAEIQAQVQSGTYKIDALELSKRIIQEHTVR